MISIYRVTRVCVEHEQSGCDTHCCQRLEMRPAKLVRSLPGPIRSLTLAGALSATKKNGDCEVFIRLLDKHYSLMQFFVAVYSYPAEKTFIYLKAAKRLPQGRISFNRAQWLWYWTRHCWAVRLEPSIYS